MVDLVQIFNINYKNIYYILASIVAIITILAYIKNFFGLKNKFDRLGYYIKQCFVFISLFPRLRKVGEENSQNYESMIDFNIDYSIFHYGTYIFVDTTISNPYFKFKYSITNHSIYDFKIDKIEMQIRYQGNKLCPQITQEGPDLPHQKTISGETKIEGLHINVINLLKSEIKAKNKLLFQIEDININFIGNKKSSRNYPICQMEIPIDRMKINQ